MDKERQSQLARRGAVLALTVCFLVFLVIVLSSLGGGGSSQRRPASRHATTTTAQSGAASYVVKEGDTLSAIAQKTGVPLTQLQALNPQIDPQALRAGERLSLR